MRTKTPKFIAIMLLLSTAIVFSQNLVKPLWTDTIPNSQKSDDKEIIEEKDILVVSYVQNPDISVYLPAKRTATRQAVVICPGGGYWVLAYDWEGTDIARYFNSIGVAAIVLKYRLPVSKSNVIPHKSPLLDAQRAIRMTRHHAEEWNIDKSKIGIMGFSAGGHLASTASTHFDYGNPDAPDPVDRQSCRPDFSILMYPVISFTDSSVHKGSRKNLIGENPDQELVTYYSNELQVSQDTPPAFLVHADDDKGVPVENSLLYYQALRKFNIPAALHVFPKGGHGFGLGLGKGAAASWTDLCKVWLQEMNTN